MDAVIDSILAWAQAEDAVRLVVITSTRARAEGPPDELSDYDIVLALTDLDRFDPAVCGTPAARWGDEHDQHGTRCFFRGVVYADGLKVDWTLWPANVPALIAEHGLDDNLDGGYRVLLDKDGATAQWPAPTFRAHIPAKPSEDEYVALVEEFWWSATYVAKARARGEEFFARWVLDRDITYEVVRRMLEWKIELERDWNWKPGAYGRGIERELPPADVEELLAARGSFDRTAALFRRIAREVGAALGYAYPQYAEDAVSAYAAKLGCLRPVLVTDLPVLYEYEQDPEAAAMAAFPSRDRDAFMAYWAKVLANDALVTRTIVSDGEVAGNIGCWPDGEQRLLGYWIGRKFWGRGLATRALAELAATIDTRPLRAYVAKHNVASIRVLEKCGFVQLEEHAGDDGVVELLMELR